MTNEVATQQGGAVISADELALMKQYGHATDFKKEDLGQPYIQIVQASSGYAKRSDPAYIDGAQEGDIIDTLTLRLRKRAAFIPAKFQTEYTEWGPDEGNKRGKLVARHGTDRTKYDAAKWFEHEGKLVEWGPRTDEATGNNIVPSAVYYGLLVDEDGTSIEAILTLTGTQSRKSRRFNDLINALEMPDGNGGVIPAPCFARVYALSTIPESGGDNSWMGWKIEPGVMTLRAPGGRHLFEKAAKYRQRVEAGQVKGMETVHAEEAQRGDGGDGVVAGRDAQPAAQNRRTAGRTRKNDLGEDIPF